MTLMVDIKNTSLTTFFLGKDNLSSYLNALLIVQLYRLFERYFLHHNTTFVTMLSYISYVEFIRLIGVMYTSDNI